MRCGAAPGVGRSRERSRTMSAARSQAYRRATQRESQRTLAESLAWNTPLLLAVLAWLVMAIYGYLTCPPPTITGDPLLDKLSGALTVRLFTCGQNDMFSEFYYATLPDEVFAAWRLEFGDDPRFWMLRYWLTSEFWNCERDDRAYIDRDDYLKEARQRGATNGAVLLSLASRCDYYWCSEVDRYAEVNPPARNESWGPYYMAIRALVDEKYGPEQQALLDELMAAAPDQAFVYYYVGFIEAQRGNFEQAIELIAEGNRAPHCSNQIGFPFDELVARTRAGDYLVDKVIDGSLWTTYVNMYFPRVIRLRETFQLLCEQAVQTQNLEALDELHTLACRYGMADSAETFQVRTAIELLGCAGFAFTSNWPMALTAEQAQAVAQMKPRRQAVGNTLQTQARSSVRWLSSLRPYQFAVINMKARLFGSGWFAIWYFDNFYQNAQRQHAVVAGPVKQVFEDLARFDYTTLSWEE